MPPIYHKISITQIPSKSGIMYKYCRDMQRISIKMLSNLRFLRLKQIICRMITPICIGFRILCYEKIKIKKFLLSRHQRKNLSLRNNLQKDADPNNIAIIQKIYLEKLLFYELNSILHQALKYQYQSNLQQSQSLFQVISSPSNYLK